MFALAARDVAAAVLAPEKPQADLGWMRSPFSWDVGDPSDGSARQAGDGSAATRPDQESLPLLNISR